MKKILPISIKPNFTSNTVGSNGLRQNDSGKNHTENLNVAFPTACVLPSVRATAD